MSLGVDRLRSGHGPKKLAHLLIALLFYLATESQEPLVSLRLPSKRFAQMLLGLATHPCAPFVSGGCYTATPTEPRSRRPLHLALNPPEKHSADSLPFSPTTELIGLSPLGDGAARRRNLPSVALQLLRASRPSTPCPPGQVRASMPHHRASTQREWPLRSLVRAGKRAPDGSTPRDCAPRGV